MFHFQPSTTWLDILLWQIVAFFCSQIRRLVLCLLLHHCVKGYWVWCAMGLGLRVGGKWVF